MTSRKALIQWYLDREGIISYSSVDRLGPNSYDSASAMFSALIAGNFLPARSALGSVSVLYQLDTVLLHEINRRDIQEGDIFIAGFKGDGLSEDAYCGVVLSWSEIIYCKESAGGIERARIYPWSPFRVRWYRLAEPFSANFKPIMHQHGNRIFAN